MSMNKKLHRSSKNKMIAGVCGGIAEYFGWDPTVVRLVYALISCLCAGFPGILVYLIFAIVVPLDTKSDSSDLSDEDVDNLDSANI